MPPAITKPPSVGEWNKHKSTIQRFRHQGMKLEDIMKHMDSKYKFIASKNQYQRKFKEPQWNFSKNVSKADWEYILCKVAKRQGLEKPTLVTLFGQEVPESKIKKARYQFPMLELNRIENLSPAPPTPNGISVHTPLYSQPANTRRSLTRVPRTASSSKARPTNDSGEDGEDVVIMFVISNDPYKETQSNNAAYHGQQKQIPYLQFLDLFHLLDLGKYFITHQNLRQLIELHRVFADSEQTLFKPEIFDAEPSNHWDPFMYLDDLDTVGDLMSLPGEELSDQRRNPTIIRSFATLLFSNFIASQAGDTLDELEIIQYFLPKMLANMPERESGDKNITLGTLLGPPQLSAGIRLVEVIIYLCSNSLLPSDILRYNQAMHWVADHVPMQSMRSLLQNQSPTLQAFRFQLLRFGVRTGRESLVADLLCTDNGLKEFVLRSTSLLSDAIRDNNVEMTKLLLKFGLDILATKQFEKVKAGLLRDCQSNTMANLLSKEVAVTVSQDARVKDIGDSALLSAIQRRDTEMVQFLIEAGANVNVFVDGNWGDFSGWVDDTWGRVLIDERWGKVTALSLAVSSGQTEILRLILEGNADVHVQTVCRDEYFQSDLTIEELDNFSKILFIGTALQAAAARGRTDIVQLLFEKGSNINEPLQGQNAMTALQAAVHFGHVDTANFLLEYGADVNASATNYEPSRTALLTATTSKNLVMVKLLLDFGAELEPLAWRPDAVALMAVIEAARAQGGDSNVLQVVQSGNAELANEAACSRTQLCHAIQRGDIEAVHNLVNSGACIDAKPVDEACWFKLPTDDDLMEDKFDEWWDRPRRLGQVRSSSERATMLHMSITSNPPVDSLVFIYLFEKMIDARAYHMEEHLEPLLHTAVRWRRFDIIDFLLNGTDIDTPAQLCKNSKFKVTILNLAARSNDVEMATMLLERGANVNSVTPGDVEFQLEAALKQSHLPTASQNFKVAKLLLSRGAAVDIALNIPKDTPLQIAARDGNLEIIRILLQRGAPVNQYWKCNITPLMAATLGEHLEAVKLLLDNGADADPHIYDYGFYSDQGSALQYAARGGSFAIAQLLLERGANVNAVGPESTVFGRTPLETGAMYGALDIVQLFLNARADSHLPPKRRYASALRIAKEDYFEPNFGIMKLLQEYRQEALDEWNSARILELDS